MKKAFLAFLLIVVFACLNQSEALGAVAYKIKKGDTLWDLSKKHGTSVKRLVALNPQICDPDLIYAGNKLYLPDKKAAAQKKIAALETQVSDLSAKNKELAGQLELAQKEKNLYQQEAYDLVALNKWTERAIKLESANKSLKAAIIAMAVLFFIILVFGLLLWRRFTPVGLDQIEMQRTDGKTYMVLIQKKPGFL